MGVVRSYIGDASRQYLKEFPMSNFGSGSILDGISRRFALRWAESHLDHFVGWLHDRGLIEYVDEKDPYLRP